MVYQNGASRILRNAHQRLMVYPARRLFPSFDARHVRDWVQGILHAESRLSSCALNDIEQAGGSLISAIDALCDG